MENYIEVNKSLWNQRTAVHIESDFYQMDAFKAGKTSLQKIELEILKNIKDKEVLHLQCHFGQDSLSLARMGAKVSAVDFSDQAIEVANQLAEEIGIEANFYCGDVMKLDQFLPETYQADLIFTTYGVIGWLPELDTWAKHIHHFLKPEGELLLVEFHPVLWMFDDEVKEVAYSYFNKEAIIEQEEATYADKNAQINAKSYGWNHSLDEVISALLGVGLQVELFKEYDYSPYDIFHASSPHPEGFQVKGMEGKLPLVYALKCRKP
jgi:2-polyprenyl-3-methyl-5-hydroxy-6-metoxy-1,4-benzoquinol methylase